MTTGDVKRKLTAIFSADVEGYSRLMEEDELATVETLTSHKEIMRKLIRQYRGRVVDSTGDNLLAEFASVVDAVQCAVEVQQVLSAKNEALPENRRMSFRIGINSGDVIEEGEIIYGDGVNVAARVESLAEGGGISISGTAFDQLGKKLPLGYEYVGEQAVKNIRKPVRVYRVLTEEEAVGKVIGEARPKSKQLRGVAIGAVAVLIIVAGALAIWNFYFRPAFEPASAERMAFPLPDKPSIAVMAFVNMSDDPKQEYLADGITENIISALSRVPNLFVIARQSTFSYKGKPVKIQQVAEELGVRYVLEGSVQRSGDKIRITAQLIDAITGHHLWSERYDRELKNIFALQDAITIKIITALRVKLTEGEQARLRAKATENLEAYLKYLEGREQLLTSTREGNVLARRLFEETIALDPKIPAAYYALGATHWMDIFLKSSKSPKESLERAFKLTKKAVTLDDSDPKAHSLLGWLYTMARQYDKAIAECDRAIALAPNSAHAHIWMGYALRYAGRHEEAVRYSERAIRLNPIPPGFYFRSLGAAYNFTGRYEEAITVLKKALNRSPNDPLSRLALANAYIRSNREEEARAKVTEALRLNPKLCIEHIAKTWPYKNQPDKDFIIAGLRKAGLPETPPLPLPDKPSIAVLPFDNLTGDPEQEYFSDGITEAIINGLSKITNLFVIARKSSFTYKGKQVKVQQVSEELGVRYVLEGSVQKSGDRVRITAQLVDAIKGHHLWSNSYDRDLKDIFALQDEIMMKIMTALRVKLTEGEQARVWAKGVKNVQAYLKLLKGTDHYIKRTPSDNKLARQFFKEVIEIDPESSVAYAFLSYTHIVDRIFKTTKDLKKSLQIAFEMAEKALALDESNPDGHLALAWARQMNGEHDMSILAAEQGVALSPNYALANRRLGVSLIFSGRPAEGIPWIRKAMRLNPFDKAMFPAMLGLAYWNLGQYDEAISVLKDVVKNAPNFFQGHLYLAVTYAESGHEEEARAEIKELLRLNPKLSLASMKKVSKRNWKKESDGDRWYEALRKGGLK